LSLNSSTGEITVRRPGRVEITVDALMGHEKVYDGGGEVSDSGTQTYLEEENVAEVEIRLNGVSKRSLWSLSNGSQRYHPVSRHVNMIVGVGDVIDFNGISLSTVAYMYFRRDNVHNGCTIVWKELV